MSEKNQQPTENPTVKVTVVEIPVAELNAIRVENIALKADNKRLKEEANNAKMYESLYLGSQKDLESLNARISAIKNVLAI